LVEVTPPVTTDSLSGDLLAISAVKYAEFWPVIRECVDACVTVYRMYGFKDDGFSRKGCYEYYYSLVTYYEGDWMKMFKDKMNLFFTTGMISIWGSLDREIPEYLGGDFNTPNILLGGRAYRFAQYLSRGNPKLYQSFLISILYAKKGLPRPGKHYMKKGVKKTFTKLTTVKPESFNNSQVVSDSWDRSSGDFDDIRDKVHYLPHKLTREIIEDALDRTVTELFEGKSFTDADRLEPIFPSTSSNYNNTITELGTVGYILEHADRFLTGLQTDAPLIHMSLFESGKATRVQVDDSQLRARCAELYLRLLDYALTEELSEAELVALSEALKVRVISKGPPALYFVLKPLQKFMWSVLKNHRLFRLIGEPVSEYLLQESIGGSLKEGDGFLSVDYSDATNELLSWVSERIATRMGELCLYPEETYLLVKSLTGHVIVDGSDKDRFVKADQVSGQLMGSVTSFPILCIANAMVIRLTRELRLGRKVSLSQLKALINGDDALIKCDPLEKVIWARVASFCGLSPSVGKVYFSPRYLNINSTSFEFHPDGWTSYFQLKKEELDNMIAYEAEQGYVRSSNPSSFLNQQVIVVEEKNLSDLNLYSRRFLYFRAIPYVNLGLAFGMGRSSAITNSSDFDLKDLASLSAQAHELIDRAPSEVRPSVLKTFLNSLWMKFADKESIGKNGKKTISKPTGRVPWFLPLHLGGLGLPSLKLNDKNLGLPSKEDLITANLFRLNPGRFPIPKPRPTNLWLTWQYAEKEYKQRFKSLERIAVSSSIDFPIAQKSYSGTSLLGKLCIEALFRLNKTDLAPLLVRKDDLIRQGKDHKAASAEIDGKIAKARYLHLKQLKQLWDSPLKIAKKENLFIPPPLSDKNLNDPLNPNPHDVSTYELLENWAPWVRL